ncbi:MAG: hypothetical protein FJW30_15780 [Acidobacteria bacterium]|nr:hypothetical protein [Acidobacteriota bacterium]
MFAFFQWLEATGGSLALRESILAYPIVESTHVLSLCLFFGLIGLMDLRLLGWALPNVPVTQFTSRIQPIGVVGFAVMVISGLLLFYSGPIRAYTNIFFRVKMILIALAGLNALLFHATIFKSVGDWESATLPPPRARLAGALSLLFWSGVVVCGRMQAYKWFD